MVTLQLEIPDELSIQLQHDAEQEGVSISAYATRKLSAPSKARPGTLLEAILPFTSTVANDVGTPTSSRNAGEQFTDYLEQKRRNGNL